ncbi:MAG: protein translocase subunit SecDF [Bacteroidales bacterium]|nr:protein translocase subunit SecDF [Bacteroidales bacterium]
MQNKGAIRLLAILLVLASLYQLSFSFVTSRVKSKAAAYAQGDEAKEAQYLDSIGSKEVYNFVWIRKYTYKECLERELNFGLDLKGGMNVILEISVPDVVVALSDNSQDPAFLNALKAAKEAQKNSQEDFIDLFGKAFEQQNPNGKLSSIFTTLSLKDRVNFNSTNDKVLDVLKDESEAAIANSFLVLRTRIDRFGVTQPNIQQLSGQTGRILVELPGVKDPERVKKLLKGTANLEFWETYDVKDLWNNFETANAKLKSMVDAGWTLENAEGEAVANATPTNDVIADAEQTVIDTTKSILDLSDTTSIIAANDTAKIDQSKMTMEEFAKRNPLFAVLNPMVDRNGQLYSGAAVGYSHYADTGKVNKYLELNQIKEIFPRDVKFLWCVKSPEWDKEGKYFELVAIHVTNRDQTAPLTGDAVTNAREEFNERNAYAQVSMTMNGEGAKTWARITKDNIGKQVAIVLDNFVYSFPTVQSEIKGGSSQITGNFTVTEAKDLANILKSGKLPAPAKIIEEEIVGPSLGQATIDKGMWSFIGAFLVVILYMIIYYRKAGIAASLALVLNVFLLFGVLASLGAVLTLPGIAGIVLTMGMAVDANVIIFERIREELHSGKGLKLAVKEGYSNSYSAIIDGNVTTILTGIILYIFGHGPIQGFATTLVIGILTTLFTSIFITRLVMERWLSKDQDISFWSKWNEFAMKNTHIKFIDNRKKFYIISGAVILIGIASMAIKGFDKGVDFLGGRTYTVKFDQPVNSNDITSTLEVPFESAPLVKTFGSDDQVKIITKYRIDDEGENVDAEIEAMLYDNLLKYYKNQTITKEMFLQGFVFDASGNPQLSTSANKSTYGFQSSSKVGPTIADDIMYSAILAVVFSLIVMFLYIFLRFKKGSYGAGATLALTHDVLFVLGIFSLFSHILPFSMEIDQSFIAAILTIVGYSINDTVVVFDRIREFIGLHPKTELKENVNSAINSTLSRTINTSLTTIFVLLVIFIFGGEVIRGFVFALLLGTIVGTYSSVCIASPISYDILSKMNKKEENKDVMPSKK